MAHQWLRQGLLASAFPLLTDLWGSTLAIPGQDISETNEDNSPQMFYAENVMPSAEGYQSIGWNFQVASSAGATDFNQVYGISQPNPSYSATNPIAVLRCLAATSFTDKTHLYIYDPIDAPSMWSKYLLPVASAIAPANISTSFINGLSYIWLANKGMFHYDGTVPGLVADVTTGLTVANVIGITSANGYNIAYTKNAVAWSSLVNPLDFIPSLVTGAGGGNIGEIKGSIVCALQISGGFLLYCTGNIVQASYTGNVQSPFKFQEIPGSGGVNNQKQISWQDNASNHYAWTTKGLQALAIGSEASPLLPQIEEYLTCGYIEVMDPVTFEITRSATAGSDVSPLLSLIGGQYLVLSLPGIEIIAPGHYFNYSQAIIYDIALKRMGKIVRDHVDVFDFLVDDSLVDIGPLEVRNTLAFIDNTGEVNTIDFSFTYDDNKIGDNSSKMILGRYQLQRNKGVYYQGLELENVFQAQMTAWVIPSLNGKSLLPAKQLRVIEEDGSYKRYGSTVEVGPRTYGKNVNVLIIGAFNLASVGVNLQLGADFA